MDRQSRKNYVGMYFACAAVAIAGMLMGDYRTIPQGMKEIFFHDAILITDYIAIVGTAACFFNVALTTFASAMLLRINHVPMHGKSMFALGLTAGFSFFGKNIYTMWFILLGTYLLSVVCKEKFGKNLISGLLATSLGPAVGVAYLHNGVTVMSLLAATVVGIIIGFTIPLLAAHTGSLLRGLNLYNGGFAVGLLSLILVPVMQGLGYSFESESTWSTGYNLIFSVFLYLLSLALMIAGYVTDPKNAFTNYKNILKRPGVAKDDFTELDGMSAVLINMAVNIIICTTYILLIGGSINGPTLGCIFTVMGFSANGKHAKNIIPILIGIFLGSALNIDASPTMPSIQMAAFLGMTLAPVAGTYGFFAGVAAAFLHSFAVLKVGLGYSAANLYNNGFSGGVITLVLYPVFAAFCKKVNSYSTPSPSRIKMHVTKETLVTRDETSQDLGIESCDIRKQSGFFEKLKKMKM